MNKKEIEKILKDNLIEGIEFSVSDHESEKDCYTIRVTYNHNNKKRYSAVAYHKDDLDENFLKKNIITDINDIFKEDVKKGLFN